MRNVFIIAILFLSSFFVKAQEVKWHTDVADAAKIALAEKKPLFFFFTGSDWCGWCIRLQKEVFKTEAFEKWAKENVVLVELDYPRRTQLDEATRAQNANMQQMFGVTGYPTVWFVTPVQKEGKKVNLEALGNMGYERGGPEVWTTKANQIINRFN